MLRTMSDMTRRDALASFVLQPFSIKWNCQKRVAFLTALSRDENGDDIPIEVLTISKRPLLDASELHRIHR